MAFTPNVVDGNVILAQWGNEVRDRTSQVFATAAERDAQWAAPPNGATCITLDTATQWRRLAGAWTAVQPGTVVTSTTWGASGQWQNVARVQLAALPAFTPVPGRRYVISGYATGQVASGSDIMNVFVNWAAGDAVSTFMRFITGGTDAGSFPLSSFLVAPSATPISLIVQMSCSLASGIIKSLGGALVVTDGG